MKAHLLIAAILVAVVSCTPDAALGPSKVPTAHSPTDSAADTPVDSAAHTPPDTSKVVRVGYYVSPDGQPDGFGTKEAPWDLQTALDQPGKVQAGDTIWMLKGTYKNSKHAFVSKLTGTADKPVVLRAYPGKRATIDGDFTAVGSYAWYWGFEVDFSDPERSTSTTGSNPSDLPRYGTGVSTKPPGSYNRFINLVIHDLANGIGDASEVHGTEIYGCIIYNNGWLAPDRAHGHGIYVQNEFEEKRIADNVVFDNFSTGVQLDGSSDAFVMHMLVEGNTIFGSGAPSLGQYGYTWNLEVYGGGPNLGDITLRDNSIYQVASTSPAILLGRLGQDTPTHPLTFASNIVQGVTEFNEWKRLTVHGNHLTSGPTPLSGGSRLVIARLPAGTATSAYDWDGNMYADVPSPGVNTFTTFVNGTGAGYADLTSWQAATGWDKSATYIPGEFPADTIIVRPNDYEPGRATITVWNWLGQSSVSIDVSAILQPGDSFNVHNVYDVYDNPVLQGKYTGGFISIPVKAAAPPAPKGLPITMPSYSPELSVFLLQRVDSIH